MNFNGNFLKIAEVDSTPLAILVSELGEAAWTANESRQQRYEVHKSTQTVGLVFDPDFRHTHPTRLPLLETFAAELQPVLALVAEHYESTPDGQVLMERFGRGYFVRATVARLLAGRSIAPHTDNNFSLTHWHRVHVPLVTNDRVRFQVGSKSLHLASGEIVEINNRRMHSDKNAGDEHRIHLILDYVMPGEQCCCGKLLHPDTVCSPSACHATDQLLVACRCYPEH